VVVLRSRRLTSFRHRIAAIRALVSIRIFRFCESHRVIFETV